MRLSQALRISNTPRLAFVGAGGKTTALFQLARELPKPVIVTVTTHLNIDQVKLADSHWIAEKPEELAGLEDNLHGVMLVTGPIDRDRTSGLNNDLLSWLHAFCIHHALPLLLEADGARQRPLKAPAVHEPPIPEFIDMVVVLAGLSGLGKPLAEEFVHRPEIFAPLSSLSLGDTITSEALARILTHTQAGLKNIPPAARRVVLLNQVDTIELQAQAKTLAERLLPTYQSVIIASLQRSQIHAIYEPVAGIVLAAGTSSRFGQPKQLLDFRGQPFVRVVAQTALTAGLRPVVVVTGANAEAVEAALHELSLSIARNLVWQTGQSSSIQTGLRVVPPESGAVIFLLADQPQVQPMVLRTLVERHAADLSPIVAPLVAGKRANPVLFDRDTFPDLMALTGDMGGRDIFGKHTATYLPWHDESLLHDIDTPVEYENLLHQQSS